MGKLSSTVCTFCKVSCPLGPLTSLVLGGRLGKALICDAAPPPMLTEVGERGEAVDDDTAGTSSPCCSGCFWLEAMLLRKEAWKPVVPEVNSDGSLLVDGEGTAAAWEGPGTGVIGMPGGTLLLASVVAILWLSASLDSVLMKSVIFSLSMDRAA